MVIDFHAHIFPDHLAQRALASISDKSGGLRPVTSGILSDTLEKGPVWGIDRFVFLNIATSPKQQRKVNDFALSLVADGQYAFGSVHPEAEDAVEELHRIKEAGIFGVKLHPHYQGFAMDDPRMAPIYETIEKLSLPVVFHSGKDIAYPNDDKAHPKRLAQVVRSFPGMTVIAAHMGAWNCAEDVLEHLAGLPLYFDTSFSKGYIRTEDARAIVRAHGADRILFGTDAPWMDGAAALSFIDELTLTEEEKENILHKNAERILKGEEQGARRS